MVKLIEELFEECVPELNKCYNFCKDIKFPSGDVGEDEDHAKGVKFKKPLKEGRLNVYYGYLQKPCLLMFYPREARTKQTY